MKKSSDSKSHLLLKVLAVCSLSLVASLVLSVSAQAQLRSLWFESESSALDGDVEKLPGSDAFGENYIVFNKNNYLNFNLTSPSFSTGFESNTDLRPNVINDLGIENWIEFGNYRGGPAGQGAEYSITTDESYGGDKSFYLGVTDISKSRRAELNIFLQDLVEDEVTVSGWYLLPEDFSIGGDGSDGYWYEIASLMSEYEAGFDHYYSLHINQPDPTVDDFELNLFNRYTPSGGSPVVVDTNSDIDLPRGEWFNIRYYINRDETDGEVTVWLNNEQVLSVQDVRTKDKDSWKTIPAKVYYPQNDTNPRGMYFDNLQIFDEFAEPVAL